MKTLATIGSSGISLREFVHLLQDSHVTKLIDIRLKNTSQLAGFSKKEDLAFILETFEIGYEHNVQLAPTEEIMQDYKKKLISPDEFGKRYLELLKDRQIEEKLDEILGDSETVCFLCSEHKPQHCHRKVLVDYIKQLRTDIGIVHL